MTRTQTAVQRLRDVPLFRSLSADRLKDLLEGAGQRELRPREILYEQDDSASSCFVVLSGTMQFSVRLGQQRAIASLAFTDDVFGLEALRSRPVQLETAAAVCATQLLVIDASALERFLLDHPQFQLDLLDYVISKVHERTTHAVRTGHYDAEQKIAAYLISHSDEVSRQGQGADALSQAELADYLALTPETFCRKVSKFRQLGWIAGRGNEYTVKRQDALRRLLDR